jgi:hypothetical protein
MSNRYFNKQVTESRKPLAFGNRVKLQKIARVLKKATAPMRKKYQTKNVKRLMTSNKAYKKGGKV